LYDVLKNGVPNSSQPRTGLRFFLITATWNPLCTPGASITEKPAGPNSFSRFNFVITYRPGKAGAKPDTLTRRSGDIPKKGDERLLHQSQTILKPHNRAINANSILDDNEEPNPYHDEENATEPDEQETPFEQLWEAAYDADPIPYEVLKTMRQGLRRSKQLSIAECYEQHGKLVNQKRLYMPK
jgi:hypothetical protein